jgi:formamidopyrimidine-DNA glycosylase
MPELPEAEVVATQLRAALVGGAIRTFQVHRSDIVREGLRTLGWYVEAVVSGIERRGKCVILACTKAGEIRYVVAELGMTGLLFFRLPSERFSKHTHAAWSFEGTKETALHYWNPRRFGRLYLLDASGLGRFCARRFGGDPLTMTREDFVRLTQGRRGRLKALLMHQQVIAGIGNIYANEILFRARLHPYRPADTLCGPSVRRLYDVMQRVLQQAIRDGGSSVRDFIAPDGSRGRFTRRHLVYNKAGAPCPNHCGCTIRRLAGSGQRSSFYCPACQRR